MARSTIAVAVLALALLVTGTAAAAAGRKLKGANASATGQGTAAGQFAQSGGFQDAATFSNPLASAGLAGGATYGVSIVNGKPSISTAIGEGTTLSTGGKSNTQAGVSAQGNGVPGTSASETINLGSFNGGAATQAIAAAKGLSGK